MVYDTFHYLSTVDSQYMQINPTYDYVIEEPNQVRHGRTLGGQLNSYRIETNHVRFTLPLTFVSSSDKSRIMADWRDRNEVVITMNLSSSPVSAVTKIVNVNEPLGVRSRFSDTEFDGVLFLTSVDSRGLTSGGPFILDDAFYGLLDQSYNVLL